mmetsp:Transcript_18719/g.28688  ORF Transcript_18719/g.28688 Transcript_18719/m.28688 type:complete len:179 (-) Transcript_18719:3-539(-)
MPRLAERWSASDAHAGNGAADGPDARRRVSRRERTARRSDGGGRRGSDREDAARDRARVTSGAGDGDGTGAAHRPAPPVPEKIREDGRRAGIGANGREPGRRRSASGSRRNAGRRRDDGAAAAQNALRRPRRRTSVSGTEIEIMFRSERHARPVGSKGAREGGVRLTLEGSAAGRNWE